MSGMTYLLDEERALKAKLQGMTVTDQRSQADNKPRQVGVYFTQPDPELREQRYPYVTIDLLGISKDPEREMRGVIAPEYLKPAETTLPSDTQSFIIPYPIPVNLDYQITSYARNPMHDRAIITQLQFTHLWQRFGYLSIPFTNADGGEEVNFRRLDVLDIAKRDFTEDKKRLFVNAVTVRISSEVAQGTLTDLYKAERINITDIIEMTIHQRTAETDIIYPKPYTIT
jgi:hypothetical protein